MQEQISHTSTWKTLHLPTLSDTEDQDMKTCNELSLPETESATSYKLQPEDADNFLPYQDHIKYISRPSCIPIPTK